MISKLFLAESASFFAPENLATEAVLTAAVAPGECVLFLWQNEKTVVIGKNQNAWKECRLDPLLRDGGTLVRRLSGGGAVFHDLGNLNVSFCLPRAEEDIPRQTRVILRALSTLGVQATASGRNDLELDGRKFSGHAVYRQGASACHHATLMLRVDPGALEKYLSVSPLKLRSRGVDSVRSRVVNLSDRFPSLTLDALRGALCRAFGEEYGLPVQPFPFERLSEEDRERRQALWERFASWEWTFGRRIPFDLRQQARFAWGEAELCLHVEEGHIRDCRCYTDAMDPLWIETMEQALSGVRFTREDLLAAFATLPSTGESGMRQDLENLLLKMTQT